MAFPNVSVLDNFTRANTTNTLGSNWANASFFNETSFYSISSNQVARSAGGLNANLWNQPFGGANQRVEVGITIAAGFNTAAGGRHGVLASITNLGENVNGYELYADQFGKLNLDIWQSGAVTSLSAANIPSFGILTTGDSILLVVDTNKVEGWAYKPANGWLKVISSDVKIFTHTAGYIGIRGQYSTTSRLSNFIGGEISKPPSISLLHAGINGGVKANQPVAAQGISTHEAKSSQGFLDSIGVNGHWNYYASTNAFGDPYAFGSPSLQNYRDKISDLNINFLRDSNPYNSVGETHYDDLRSKGIKVIATAPGKYISGTLQDYPNNLTSWFESLKPYADILDAFEGTNEYDLFGTNDPDKTGSLIEQQRRLYNMVKSDPATSHIPVVAPSIGHPVNTQQYADRDKLDNPNDRIWNYFDYGCWHVYPGATWPGPEYYSTLHNQMDDFYGNSKPLMSTETGFNQGTYYANIINYIAAADVIPKLICEHYAHGIERSYLYEIVDENLDRFGGTDVSTHWGQFYNYNWTEKPAAATTRNISILLSGASNTPGTLKYSINSSADLGQLLLAMNDGSFRLLIWQRVFNFNFTTKSYVAEADASATLEFAEPYNIHERKNTDTNYNSNLGNSTSFNLIISSPSVHIFEISQ